MQTFKPFFIIFLVLGIVSAQLTCAICPDEDDAGDDLVGQKGPLGAGNSTTCL